MLVSVVIPLYNKKQTIEKCVNSVLSQSCTDFEILVVDDGSTDGSADIVKKFTDNRIRLIRQDNAGVSAARNTGIKAAQGNWVAFLDADDEWMPNKLELQLAAIEKHPEAVWGAGRYILCTKYGETLSPAFNSKWFESENILKDGLLPFAAGLYLWTGTVIIKREILLSNLFDTTLKVGEDINLWLRLATIYREVVYIRTAIAKYINTLNSLNSTAVSKGLFDYDLEKQKYNSLRSLLSKDRQILLDQIMKRQAINGVTCCIRTGAHKTARKVLLSCEYKLSLWWILLFPVTYIPNIVLRGIYHGIRFLYSGLVYCTRIRLPRKIDNRKIIRLIFALSFTVGSIITEFLEAPIILLG